MKPSRLETKFIQMKKINLFGGAVCMMLFATLSGCEKYLDAKPDLRKAVPSSLEDCSALLNNYSVLNQGYPYIGELASDNFMMSSSSWQSISILEDKEMFVWNADIAPPATQWSAQYKKVYVANQVLEVLKNLKETPQSRVLKGEALFFRAYAHFALAELFAPVPLADGANKNGEAIPYRTTPNIEDPVERTSIGEFYRHLLQDAAEAAILLPHKSNVPSTPTKAAANALLTRICLYLQDYPKTVQYANACLDEKSDLLDFETLSTTSNTPIARFNREVIFQAIAVGSATYTRTRWKVDSALMERYDDADLRKSVFFIKNADGTYSYKGNYDGQLNQAPFSGLAVDEIVISRAEAYLRTGKVDSALMDLNMLRRSRWLKSQFTPVTEKNPQKLLDIILNERRRELIMRQRRWTDLKRLNLHPLTAQTLHRNIVEKEYVLPPGDGRYTMLIPLAVLENSTLQQTKR